MNNLNNMIEINSSSLREYELIKGTFENIKQSVLFKIKDGNISWKFLDEFFGILDYLTCFFNQISQTYHILPNSIENKELFLSNLIKINRDLFELNLLKFIEKVSKDDSPPTSTSSTSSSFLKQDKKPFSKSPYPKHIININDKTHIQKQINNDIKSTPRTDIRLLKNGNKGIYKKNNNTTICNEGKIFKVQPFKDIKSKVLVSKRSKMNVSNNFKQNRSSSSNVGNENEVRFKTTNNSKEKEMRMENMDGKEGEENIGNIGKIGEKEVNIYVKPKAKEQNLKTLTPKKLNKRINNYSAHDIMCLSADKTNEGKCKKIVNIPFKDDKIPSKVFICNGNTETESKIGEDEELNINNTNNNEQSIESEK